MQIKTINKTIRNKMDEWLNTISDKNLAKQLKDDIIVTGGSIASMLLKEDVNDFDIYIRSRQTLLHLVQYYTIGTDTVILDGEKKDDYVKELSNKSEDTRNQWEIAIWNLTPDRIRIFITGSRGGLRVNEDIPKSEKKYVVKFISPNAISLSDKIQIVNRFWGTPEQIHENFDFVHATNYWTYENGVVLNLPAMTSLLTRQLKYTGSKYPVTSVIRTRKFINRKWNINAGEYLKILFQVSKLDLSDVNVLEDQLIGVDIAYFDTLISALRNKPASTELTSTYLGELIDKIFNADDETD